MKRPLVSKNVRTKQKSKSFELLSDHLKQCANNQIAVDRLWSKLSKRWNQYKRDRGEVLVTDYSGRLIEVDTLTGEPLEATAHNNRLLLIVDVETTGFEPSEGAEIIELAYVVVLQPSRRCDA